MEQAINFWTEKVKLEAEWTKYQNETEILQKVTLCDAIDRLLIFKDSPVGPLENEIDSVLIDFETSFLEEYLKRVRGTR